MELKPTSPEVIVQMRKEFKLKAIEHERTYTDLPAQSQKKRLESWHPKPEAMKQTL